jgi:6-phospho-3-hexuloisomerase
MDRGDAMNQKDTDHTRRKARISPAIPSSRSGPSEKKPVPRVPLKPEDRDIFTGFMESYLQYLVLVTKTIISQNEKIVPLLDLIFTARKIHVYGFGRSGPAAYSFASRLCQLCEVLPDVWWMGDLVRPSMHKGDLLIIFSGSGARPETLQVASQAAKQGIGFVLITKTEVSPVREKAALVIDLPPVPAPGRLFGSGDFELACSYFQEALVAAIGKKSGVPSLSTDRWIPEKT